MPSYRLLGRSAVLVAGLVAAVPACSDDTGILLRVTRADEAKDLAELPQLEVFVGIAMDDEGSDFMGDAEKTRTIATPGRDLAGRPFTVLLKPSAALPSDAELFAVAVGTNADGTKAVAVAGIEHDGTPRTVHFAQDQILEWNLVLRPLRRERVMINPHGCLTWQREDGTWVVRAAIDPDCDDQIPPEDCNNNDPNIFKGATEDCATDVDEDCDGNGHNETDRDRDKVTNCAGDCDDRDPEVFPGAPDRCDGKDNDCKADTPCDPDVDGDGYTVCGKIKRVNGGTVCQAFLAVDEMCPLGEECDCAEGDPKRHPNAKEICDGKDNNCDAECDPDNDKDGYTECGRITYNADRSNSTCTPCEVPGAMCDCAPDDPTAGGVGPERCDGLDANCDEVLFPEVSPCFVPDPTSPTKCVAGERTCDDTTTDAPFGACMRSEGDDVPSPLCATYAQCERDGAADPFECSVRLIRAEELVCRATLDSGTTMCASNEVDLSSFFGGGATCSWRIFGGERHGPWTVIVKDGINPCAARLIVTAAATPAEETITPVLLLRSEPPSFTFVRVDLNAKFLSPCGDTKGLECKKADPLP